MKNKMPGSLLGLLTIGSVAVIAGCASTTAQPLAIMSEMDSGNAIRITSVQARPNEDGVLVSGGLARNIPYSVPRGAHLHVVAVDAKDKVLGSGLSTINPHMLQRGHRGQPTPAMYTSQLKVVPESVSKVKVIYHDHHHSECSEKDG